MLKRFAFMMLACTLLTTSCGNKNKTNLSIPGVIGPEVNLVDEFVIVSAVIENLNLDAGGTVQLPKLSKSTLEIGPDLQSDGTLLSFKISVNDILNAANANQLDPTTLPGGRPLPGVIGGSLPAIAFTIEKLEQISFYVGPKFFGIFVPVPQMNIQDSIITARFYVKGERLGNLSLVGLDAQEKNGGFLLLLDLNKKVKDQLIRYMKNRR